jgi:preprotein translocase subunit SecD
MNKNPFWKYILLVALIVPALLYSLPNVYDNDPGLQVKGSRGVDINTETMSRVESALSSAGIEIKTMELDSNALKLSFNNTQDQLAAKKKVDDSLGNQYFSALSSMSTSPKFLSNLGALPMFLGLDLRGGVHFLIQVDTEDAIERSRKSLIGEVRTALRVNKIQSIGSPVSVGVKDFDIKFETEDLRAKASQRIAVDLPSLSLLDIDQPESFILRASLSDRSIDAIKASAITKNIQSLRSRVDAIGVAEPIVQQQGSDRIVVQLPGVQDPAQARRILGSTATLEVYLVDEKNAGSVNSSRIPSGSAKYFFRDGSPILLKRRLIYSGECIIDASSGFGHQDGGAIVNITLDSRCGGINFKVTSENVNKRMAVVYVEPKTSISVDAAGKQTIKKTVVKEVITAPVINEALRSNFQINGMESQQEARELALSLKAGSLAPPIYIIEERTMGPSLGKENIEKGFQSVVYGFLAVLLFMLVYYRFFGGVASVALILNLVIIVAVLSIFQATLTLPGVAGIVLTVGMAVDANVLIFERIREEIRAGTAPQLSIHAGYDKAFSTIVDANITTLIAAIVLYVFGSGPVQGFALTLGIGIMTSMFTAIFVSRVLVNSIYGGRKLEKISI